MRFVPHQFFIKRHKLFVFLFLLANNIDSPYNLKINEFFMSHSVKIYDTCIGCVRVVELSIHQ